MRRFLIAVVVMVLGACSSSSSSSSPGSSAAGGSDLTVFAASSLAGAFTKIGSDFEAGNAGTHVVFNFGSSTDLATQIGSEGTADVFASASGTAMDTVEQTPGVSDRTDFATNRLVVIVPTDNPANIATLADLGNDGVLVVLGATGVPVGDYAREVLANADLTDRVMPNVVSNEPDDASVVAKVQSGEADAGIVYTSDLTNADVTPVDVPANVNVIATYPIAVVSGSAQPDAASAFIDYITGAQGQATLTAFGFGPPPAGA